MNAPSQLIPVIYQHDFDHHQKCYFNSHSCTLTYVHNSLNIDDWCLLTGGCDETSPLLWSLSLLCDSHCVSMVTDSHHLETETCGTKATRWESLESYPTVCLDLANPK